MTGLKGYDRWLIPPDPPTHAPCDKCKGEFDVDDLTEAGRNWWLCPECLDEHNQELLDEAENE